MYVFVIGLDGTRLMPCKPRKARKLIEAHKAEIYKKQPFTIRLLYKTGCATQPVTIGIDTGSQHIGIGNIRKQSLVPGRDRIAQHYGQAFAHGN